MATVELDEKTMIPAPPPPIPTGALEDAGLMIADPKQAANRETWRQVTEKVSMMRFIAFPDLEAEGLLPPVARAIEEALTVVGIITKIGTFPPPSRVLPNGEGGIVFERWEREAARLERIEVSGNGRVELSLFDHGKRIAHHRLS